MVKIPKTATISRMVTIPTMVTILRMVTIPTKVTLPKMVKILQPVPRMATIPMMVIGHLTYDGRHPWDTPNPMKRNAGNI